MVGPPAELPVRPPSWRAGSRSPHPQVRGVGHPTAMTRRGPPASASLAFDDLERLGFPLGVLLVVVEHTSCTPACLWAKSTGNVTALSGGDRAILADSRAIISCG